MKPNNFAWEYALVLGFTRFLLKGQPSVVFMGYLADALFLLISVQPNLQSAQFFIGLFVYPLKPHSDKKLRNS